MRRDCQTLLENELHISDEDCHIRKPRNLPEYLSKKYKKRFVLVQHCRELDLFVQRRFWAPRLLIANVDTPIAIASNGNIVNVHTGRCLVAARSNEALAGDEESLLRLVAATDALGGWYAQGDYLGKITVRHTNASYCSDFTVSRRSLFAAAQQDNQEYIPSQDMWTLHTPVGAVKFCVVKQRLLLVAAYGDGSVVALEIPRYKQGPASAGQLKCVFDSQESAALVPHRDAVTSMLVTRVRDAVVVIAGDAQGGLSAWNLARILDGTPAAFVSLRARNGSNQGEHPHHGLIAGIVVAPNPPSSLEEWEVERKQTADECAMVTYADDGSLRTWDVQLIVSSWDTSKESAGVLLEVSQK